MILDKKLFLNKLWIYSGGRTSDDYLFTYKIHYVIKKDRKGDLK